jgi:hypothetical protein
MNCATRRKPREYPLSSWDILFCSLNVEGFGKTYLLIQKLPLSQNEATLVYLEDQWNMNCSELIYKQLISLTIILLKFTSNSHF